MDSTSDLQMSSLQEAKAAFEATADGSSEANLVERMARFRKNPFNFAHEIYLFIRGVDWRSYDRVLGQPCFYPGYTQNIKDSVMASPLLQRKMEELTEARLKVEEEQFLLDNTKVTFVSDRARRRSEISASLIDITDQMLDNMVCKMESNTFIRGAFYGAASLLTRAYSGIHVSQKEVNRLLEVAAIAAKKKMPIIFLPRHTSHVDYVSLQLICYRLGLTLPVVVAGDNLNFPLVGPFLQSAGAMWIRRSFDDDQLYATLVQSYLDTMMQKGYNLECFIEGGRSRTGKLLGPKFGFLGFLLDSVLSGRTADAYVCPVSMQYDKVLEVDSYVNELMGKPKQKENLADFLSSSSALSLNLGRIDCRFHEPWSLKDFINEQQQRYDAGTQTTNLAESGRHSETRIRLLRTLGYRVLSDINSVAVVMPTALVGTVLLTLRGRGVGKSELARRVDWLCKRVLANGGHVADFHGMSTTYVVERALDVLGPNLVGQISGLAEETYYAEDRFQLSFYRNMTIHLFISEALIAAALYTRVKQGGGSASERMAESELIEKVTFLSQLFRGEFIFPAGQGLRNNLEEAMRCLIRDQVLETSFADPSSSNENQERNIGLSERERAQGREDYDFYCFLIWPFCDAAWLGAVSLLCIVPPTEYPDPWVSMTQAQNTAQLMGRTLYHQGDLSYFEAINKEALKNAYARFQEEGIIQVAKGKKGTTTNAAATGPTVRVAREWLPRRDEETGEIRPEGKLWDFISNISMYRREGKNRRDGASTQRRVLGLAAKLNEQFFFMENEIASDEDVSDTESTSIVQEKVPLKKRRRRSKL